MTPLVVPALVTVAYLWAAVRERGRRGWSAGSIAAFTTGSMLAAVALSPWFDARADDDFSAHMAQHVLLAMVAPLGLVLGAPVTLLLRSLPHRLARRVGRALHSRPVRAVANPLVALVLSSGGLVVLYATPLYELSARNETVHALVHVHLLTSGVLFAWVVAGPDPAPGRAGVRTRLVVLGVAVAVHASVAQLLYAGLLVQVHEPAAELRAAGTLMYYDGDLAELALAVALLVTWRPRPGPGRPLRAAGRAGGRPRSTAAPGPAAAWSCQRR